VTAVCSASRSRPAAASRDSKSANFRALSAPPPDRLGGRGPLAGELGAESVDFPVLAEERPGGPISLLNHRPEQVFPILELAAKHVRPLRLRLECAKLGTKLRERRLLGHHRHSDLRLAASHFGRKPQPLAFQGVPFGLDLVEGLGRHRRAPPVVDEFGGQNRPFRPGGLGGLLESILRRPELVDQAISLGSERLGDGVGLVVPTSGPFFVLGQLLASRIAVGSETIRHRPMIGQLTLQGSEERRLLVELRHEIAVGGPKLGALPPGQLHLAEEGDEPLVGFLPLARRLSRGEPSPGPPSDPDAEGHGERRDDPGGQPASVHRGGAPLGS